MRYILLLFLIITQMVFVFGYPAGESEEPIFSGRVAGTVSDTLQFPIREIRDNEIRQTIPSSALFLRQPSNIKDTIILIR